MLLRIVAQHGMAWHNIASEVGCLGYTKYNVGPLGYTTYKVLYSSVVTPSIGFHLPRLLHLEGAHAYRSTT